MMIWLSKLYAAIAGARRRAYERRPERRRRLSQPVVSVGNIAVGGSGKTPAVAHIARLLAAAGERPAILTRGYRRRDRSEAVVVVSDGTRMLADVGRAGDEPMMLARALPGVGVFVGPDRYSSGLLAERRFGCTVHLLDDGFQHLRLARDVDIVLVRPEDFDDRVLPAGRLREPPGVLSRADALVMVADHGASTGVGLPVFDARQHVIVDQAQRKTRAFALAGIARPERFFQALAAAGVEVAGTAAFGDHHWYTRSDVERIVASARAANAGCVLTTEKDYVRLLPLRPFAMPVDFVRLEFTIEPAEDFRRWLVERLASARRVGMTAEARA